MKETNINIVDMNNMTDLRHNLSEVFKALCAGSIEHKIACELNNNAGKIINSVKVELANKALIRTGYDPEIPFLIETHKAKLKQDKK